jgi:hypothetical protein
MWRRLNMKKVGNICHEYGHLLIKEDEGKFFWSIEANTFEEWEEIPKSLYLELYKLEEK